MSKITLEQENKSNTTQYPYKFNKKIVHDIDKMVTLFAQESLDSQLIKRTDAESFGFYGDC